ncbi:MULTISPECIES: aspartyl/asparaginyl beta-hydroxylase domain-containing protein [unclassified Sphingopyxis]|uniref:aspartyl/asparaginyl beta-hydroxylase domain-containing protein n=1 Tax=unclassified Sphingopyxis TaxID=2614943 RepID=UPI000736C0AC|nr:MULTISPECIES: aspartyl/asparaginyl beta-hydroxylase domain-containing protein [unclassified Sphingopyxis]KTE37329.1 aspartyl beta-hydroxylase [Sphingopyxis sp. HIX]KTE84286.1 aspartyl beta-hydroxylase [Sphingopyxis sp. HXXIV]
MYPNPRKTTSIRRLGSVDIAALQQAVAAIPETLWQAENADKPNRFEALDATAHIVFRFIANMRDWRTDYARPLWDEWEALLAPVMAAATVDYGYNNGIFPRVMLARMPAGGVIQPHRDANPAAKWPHKIHVPIETNDRVLFRIDGQTYHIAEGEAAEVNNMGVHAVTNGGDAPRIHLIFEYYDADQPAPDWLAALSGQPA